MRFFEAIKFWWWARKANKALLAKVAVADRTPYPPPTSEEVANFKQEMENKGVSFDSMCCGLPPSPRRSKEVTLTF